MSEDIIRLAKPSDAAAILDIYAPFIRETSLTFETEVPSVEDFAERIRSYLVNWPWLVFEQNGEIGGYAYASKHRERTGYQWCVESSIYIRDKYKGRGVAFALYKSLFHILEKQGYRNVYAVINLPNETSVAFHERCGFEFFAEYKNVGYKLGRWKTVGWWLLRLNDYSDEPPPPVRFSDLDKSFLPALFKTMQDEIKFP